jgi:hypothetical protein
LPATGTVHCRVYHGQTTFCDIPGINAGGASIPSKCVTSFFSDLSASTANIINIMHGTRTRELSKGIPRLLLLQLLIVVVVVAIFGHDIKRKLVEYQEVNQRAA